MTVLKEIKRLIEWFRENRDGCFWSAYNEAQVRLELINPFFEVLGWEPLST